VDFAQLCKRLAFNLEKLRKAQSLNMTGQRAGMSPTNPKKIRKQAANPTLRTLAKLAELFVVDPRALIDPPPDEDPTTRPPYKQPDPP
jgi:transcriptional regulator with XRE-family HTH domain